MDKSPFTGCIPALMTPCRADGTPDFDALVRKGLELIGLGMSGVVYCGSMGDWPLLTDAERDWLNTYHKRVWTEISPALKGKVKDWLKQATAAI